MILAPDSEDYANTYPEAIRVPSLRARDLQISVAKTIQGTMLAARMGNLNL